MPADSRLAHLGQLANRYLTQTGRSSIARRALRRASIYLRLRRKARGIRHDADILVEIDLISILVGTRHRPLVMPDESGSERVERHQDREIQTPRTMAMLPKLSTAMATRAEICGVGALTEPFRRLSRRNRRTCSSRR
jgi:hypothetical protein